MISQEKKDQIDNVATDIAILETAKERRQEINAELTNYAEKLEEKYKEIEGHKHRGDKGMEAAKFYQEQLAQLKEITTKLAIALEYPNLTTQSETSKAITAYAEWCKQNLK